MKKIILAILLIVFPLSSFAAKRALLVGINDYQRLPCTLPGRGLISDLRGSLNDVRIVRNILISRYGFSPNEIKCLTERNARREDILKAFNEWLINGSREGDLVLFYFSGHGARVTDQNGDERDKYDEALCPYDVVPYGGQNIILDDELGDMLRRLKGRDVIVILDACHSGGMVRSIRGRAVANLEQTPAIHRKFIPIINYRPYYFPKEVLPDRPQYCLFMTASKEDQIALETNEPGDFYGAFTYALADGLKKLREPTYEKVFDHVDKLIKDRLKLPQDPQISPRERDIIVQHVFKARPQKPPVITMPAPQPPPEIRERNVLVKIEPFGTSADMQKLRNRLEGITYVDLVENDLFDRLIRGKVEEGRYKVRLLNRIGDVITIPPKENIDEVVKAMIPHLEYAYMVKQLAYISHPNPPFKVELWVTDKKRRDFRLGEKITFGFKSERDCYILVINLDQEGNFHIIFPNKYYKDNFVRADKVIEIPDQRMKEELLKKGKIYFDLEFGPPAGEETVKVIATSKPLRLKDLGLEDFTQLFDDLGRISVPRTTRAIFVKKVVNSLSSGQFQWSEDTVVIRSHE